MAKILNIFLVSFSFSTAFDKDRDRDINRVLIDGWMGIVEVYWCEVSFSMFRRLFYDNNK
jgi:hypothetical protein